MADSKEDLQGLVTEFDPLCERKLKVNVKIKVMVFDGKEQDVLDLEERLEKPYENECLGMVLEGMEYLR